jgi:hypothetical protein
MSQDQSREQDLLEGITKFSTVVLAALPAVGGLMRFISFSFEPRIHPSLAVAVSVPELIVDAGRQLFPFVTFLAIWSLLMIVIARDPSNEGGSFSAYWRSVFGSWYMLVVLVVIVVVFGFAGAFPAGWIGLIGGLAALFWLGFLILHRSVSFSSIVGPAALLLVTTAFASGLKPDPVPAVYVRPTAADSALAAGWYDRVGESGGVLYLLQCGSDQGVLAIPRDALAEERYAPLKEHRAATTIDVILGRGFDMGYVSGCP